MAAKTGKHKKRRRTFSGGRKIFVLAALLGCLLLIFTGWKVWRSDAVQMRFVYMWPYQNEIMEYSAKNKIDPFLVAAIIKNESGFSHHAVSGAGAVGLMQIMPETGRWIASQMGLPDYSDEDLYKTKINIRMGCWYLGELQHEFKNNLALIMIAYNAGRGQTKSWMEENGWDYNFNDLQAIPYPDTREYVVKVLRDRDQYYLYYKNLLAQK